MFHLIHSSPSLQLLPTNNAGTLTRARAGLLFNFDTPHSTKARSSLFYYGAALWNNLPSDLRNITEFVSFKYTVRRYIDVH